MLRVLQFVNIYQESTDHITVPRVLSVEPIFSRSSDKPDGERSERSERSEWV